MKTLTLTMKTGATSTETKKVPVKNENSQYETSLMAFPIRRMADKWLTECL